MALIQVSELFDLSRDILRTSTYELIVHIPSTLGLIWTIAKSYCTCCMMLYFDIQDGRTYGRDDMIKYIAHYNTLYIYICIYI